MPGCIHGCIYHRQGLVVGTYLFYLQYSNTDLKKRKGSGNYGVKDEIKRFTFFPSHVPDFGMDPVFGSS